MRVQSPLFRRLSLVLLTVLSFACISSARSGAVQAASPHVSAFYTISKSAYDAWHNGSPAPAATASFQAGTSSVGYYIAFSGVQPGIHFQVIQHGPDGSLVKGDVHSFTKASGVFLNYFYRTPAFAPGSYFFELRVSGKSMAKAAFSVQKGIVIPQFYAITKASFDQWAKSTSDAPPAKASVFAGGTKDVGYYFSYAGTTPKVTTFRVIVYDASGAPFISGDLHKVSYNTGFFANYFFNDPSFPSGKYTMKLFINNVLSKSTAFTIS